MNDVIQNKENNFIKKYYHIPWDLLKITFEGGSSLKFPSLCISSKEQVKEFLSNHYGYNINDSDDLSEVREIHNKAISFIQNHFLIPEFNPQQLEIPKEIKEPECVTDLILLASNNRDAENFLQKWACSILRVMHIITHIYNTRPYDNFALIRQQIFDRFDEHIFVDDSSRLFLGKGKYKIPLYSFNVKMIKSFDSIVMKLLCRQKVSIKDIYDHLGVRIVTRRKCDILAALQFLREHNIISLYNIHHTRTRNTLIDIGRVKPSFENILSELQNESNFNSFYQRLEQIDYTPSKDPSEYNVHTSDFYRALHLTCRQLIKYPNPFYDKVKKIKDKIENKLKKDLLLSKELVEEIDLDNISKEKRFFYPYELQITDHKSHLINTKGYASHAEYKKTKILAARGRALVGIKF